LFSASAIPGTALQGTKISDPIASSKGGVEIREFLPEDADGLETLDRDFITQAVPRNWDDWADEPHRVLVAEQSGRIVGGVHYALVGRGEAWIEGLRVAASMRRRGVGGRLLDAAIVASEGYGAVRTRCAIPAGDEACAAVMRRAGFGAEARFEVLVAPAAPAPTAPGIRVADPRDLAALQAWLHSQPWPGVSPLVGLGWRFRGLNPQMLGGAAREERLWVTDAQKGVVAFLRCGADRVVWILAAADAASTLPLLSAAQSDLAEPGRVAVFVPSESEAVRLLLDAGYRRDPWVPAGLEVLARPQSAR